MEGTNTGPNISAARWTASVFGVLAGIGGITHAIGEIRQGNVVPDGIFIPSWTEGPIAARMGGDPAITLVPNLLLAGILTLIVSLAVVVWAALFVQRKSGGRVLIGLSGALLLVGGGVGSPVIGILAGIAGTGIESPATGERTRLPDTVRRFLAPLWPWVFAVSVINGVFLMIGAIILIYFFDVGSEEVFLNSFYFAVVSLLLTIVTGRAYDLQASERSSLSPVSRAGW